MVMCASFTVWCNKETSSSVNRNVLMGVSGERFELTEATIIQITTLYNYTERKSISECTMRWMGSISVSQKQKAGWRDLALYDES